MILRVLTTRTFASSIFFSETVVTTIGKQYQLKQLIKGVIAAYVQGVIVVNDTQSADNWNFASSFFFSATVVTTIGKQCQLKQLIKGVKAAYVQGVNVMNGAQSANNTELCQLILLLSRCYHYER